MSGAEASLPRIALVGNPNCGKTALFNLLTGARQKVANYAGVTVERKEGYTHLPDGRLVSVMDLPGAYSLNPTTADELVMRDVVLGLRDGERQPDAIIAVVDATNLRMNLRLVLQLRALGLPMLVALNMMDVARARGLQIDVPRLSAELGLPVVETIAVHNNRLADWLGKASDNGRDALLQTAQQSLPLPGSEEKQPLASTHTGIDASKSIANESPTDPTGNSTAQMLALQAQVRHILAVAVPNGAEVKRFNHRIDAVVMHPVWGLVLLAVLLYAVINWSGVDEPKAQLSSPVAGSVAVSPELEEPSAPRGSVAGRGGWPSRAGVRWFSFSVSRVWGRASVMGAPVGSAGETPGGAARSRSPFS